MRPRVVSGFVVAVLAAVVALPGVAQAQTSPSPAPSWPEPGSGAQPAKPQRLTGDKLSLQMVRKPLVLVEHNVGPVGGFFTLSADVLFEFGKATLTSSARSSIQEVASQMKEAGVTGGVQVVGHTDNVGSDKDNLELSKQRAAAVLDALEPLLANTGIELEAEGRGEKDPVASNKTDAGRAQNRRVTIEYQPTDSTQEPDQESNDISVAVTKPAPPGIGPAPGGSLASTQKTFALSGSEWTIRVDVVEFRREGPFIKLGLRTELINGPAGESFTEHPALFSGDIYEDAAAPYTVLYDKAGGKRLEIVVNGKGGRLHGLGSYNLVRGIPIYDWAYFTPPESQATKKLSLYLPAFGVLELQLQG